MSVVLPVAYTLVWSIAGIKLVTSPMGVVVHSLELIAAVPYRSDYGLLYDHCSIGGASTVKP